MRVAAGQCIRSHTDIEGILIIPPLPELFATFRIAVVAKDLEARQKLLELHLPVQQDASRHDDEMRTPDTTITGEMREQGYGLDGFSTE